MPILTGLRILRLTLVMQVLAQRPNHVQERGGMSGRRKSERGLILVEVSLNKGCGEQKSEVKLDITSFVCFVLLCIYWGVFLLK
jgi:hypothetical protein